MQRIEAAGGVLWRPADTRLGVEVALVHRRGRTSWSLPKGKLVPQEHPPLGALREVHEETGHRATLGPYLGSVGYEQGGVPKRVRYWSLATSGGEFSSSREVDDLVWLSPDAAIRLARRRDRPLLDRFWCTRADQTRPLILVRPGTLVPRTGWVGPGEDRPLSAQGRMQATAIVDLLGAFGVRRLLTADLRCCTETVQPFEDKWRVLKETVRPAEGKRRLLTALGPISTLGGEGMPIAVCAKQRDLDRLSHQVTGATGQRGSTRLDLRRGSLLALHLHATGPVRVRAEPIQLAG